MKIFRKEAISHKTSLTNYKTQFNQSNDIKIYGAILFVLLLALFASLYALDYTKKERVRGVLLPSKGMISIIANTDSYLSKINIKSGDRVTEGQILGTLKNPKILTLGGDLGQSRLESIDLKIGFLEEELNNVITIQEKDRSVNLIRQASLSNEIASLESRKVIAKETLDIHKEELDRTSSISDEGYISTAGLNRAKVEYYSDKTALVVLDGDIEKFKSNISELKESLQLKDAEHEIKISGIKSESESLKNSKKEIQIENEYSIVASVNGKVSSVNFMEGESVRKNEMLLTIIPDGSELLVKLYLPSSSAGLVQLGQVIRVRFSALPHQRFGLASGVINHIDSSLSSQDNGLGSDGSLSYYKALASIDRSSFSLNGNEIFLKPGMNLEADILIEKRSILEWVLSPLKTNYN
jgi:membrane fusion protein